MSTMTLPYTVSIYLLREQRAGLIADCERVTSNSGYFALRNAITATERAIKAHPDATPAEAAACV